MAQKNQMKASKPSATSYTASTATTEKPHINPSATCNVLNAAQKWIGQDRFGLEASLTKTSLKSMMKENRSVAFKNSARITKLLSLTKDEASAPITYFVVDKLSGKLGLPSPSIQSFINALRKNGFQAVQTHFNTRGVRTDAPITIMQKLLKEANDS